MRKTSVGSVGPGLGGRWPIRWRPGTSVEGGTRFWPSGFRVYPILAISLIQTNLDLAHLNPSQPVIADEEFICWGTLPTLLWFLWFFVFFPVFCSFGVSFFQLRVLLLYVFIFVLKKNSFFIFSLFVVFYFVFFVTSDERGLLIG